MRGRWLWVMGVVVAGGCAQAPTEPPQGQFVGHYAQGFEVNGFQPCGEEERWWVADAPELHARYPQVASRPYEEVYLVVRGEVSGAGRYGHMGAYARELRVAEVVEIRAARQGDCG